MATKQTKLASEQFSKNFFFQRSWLDLSIQPLSLKAWTLILFKISESDAQKFEFLQATTEQK